MKRLYIFLKSSCIFLVHSCLVAVPQIHQSLCLELLSAQRAFSLRKHKHNFYSDFTSFSIKLKSAMALRPPSEHITDQ